MRKLSVYVIIIILIKKSAIIKLRYQYK